MKKVIMFFVSLIISIIPVYALTSEDVVYDNNGVEESLTETLNTLYEELKTYKTGGDALASAMLKGKSAYVKGVLVTGTIESLVERTITPGTSDQVITAGVYLSGNQVIKGDANLLASNIKIGTSIFGVSGSYTSDATANAGHILENETAYVKGNKITGTIPSKGSATITPGPNNQTISSGQYLSGVQTIKGDNNLKAENIKCGISIFGITGTENCPNGNAATYIVNLAKTDTTNLVYDGTVDNNLRYIGSNPNNYVLFNNELWRIIGVMNNVSDSNGTSASRIKLIRAENIGSYTWGDDINDWNESSSQKYLNETYYMGFTDEAKNSISTIVWNLGGIRGNETWREGYIAERGTNVFEQRPTTWSGKIALAYITDYMIASGKSEYFNTRVDSCSDCMNENWLMKDSSSWSLTPVPYSDSDAWYALSNFLIDYEGTGERESFYPVVYLNTNIKIVGGNGTTNNPYLLSN